MVAAVLKNNNSKFEANARCYGKAFMIMCYARSLRKMCVDKALNHLKVTPGAKYVGVISKVIKSAADKAKQQGFDLSSLRIAELSVGTSSYLKRFEFKGRGRIGRADVPFFRVRSVLEISNGK